MSYVIGINATYIIIIYMYLKIIINQIHMTYGQNQRRLRKGGSSRVEKVHQIV